MLALLLPLLAVANAVLAGVNARLIARNRKLFRTLQGALEADAMILAGAEREAVAVLVEDLARVSAELAQYSPQLAQTYRIPALRHRADHVVGFLLPRGSPQFGPSTWRPRARSVPIVHDGLRRVE